MHPPGLMPRRLFSAGLFLASEYLCFLVLLNFLKYIGYKRSLCVIQTGDFILEVLVNGYIPKGL